MDSISGSYSCGPAFTALQIPEMSNATSFSGPSIPGVQFGKVTAIHFGKVEAITIGNFQPVVGERVSPQSASPMGGTLDVFG